MARALTNDHVLFNECINAFRPNGKQVIRYRGPSHSYLLTSFDLPMPWQLPNCTVHPSVNAPLAGASSAFICKIDNPEWCDHRNAHLYGVALSAIVTFVSGRLCKSTRDDYLCYPGSLTEAIIMELSLLHPVVTAGPGAVHTSLSAAILQRYKEQVTNLISKLHLIPYSTYVILMQAIRLVHLSLLNKKDDFGLAYLLIVSAIEAVAQHAISRKQVARKHPEEIAWSARAQHDQDFSELLQAYKEARGQNGYLKERYVKFIDKFAPVADWEQIIPHPWQDFADSFQGDVSDVLKKRWFEKYPTDLSHDEITTIVSDSYKHRSCFIHRGEQPPHLTPTSCNRFFQEYREYDEGSFINRLLPNYELLVGIAQQSILGWIDTIKNE